MRYYGSEVDWEGTDPHDVFANDPLRQVRGLGFPPYYNSDGSLDEIFSHETYPFSKHELETLPVEESWSMQLLPIMHKMARGKAVNILVLGGSETAGIECGRHMSNGRALTFKECAWSGRLLDILQSQFNNSAISLTNMAHGGTTTSVVLSGIGLLLQSLGSHFAAHIDMIILDTLVNDAYESKGWGSSRNSDWGGHKIVSVSYEALVLALHDMVPQAMIFSVLAGCPVCAKMRSAQSHVARHYQLGLLDYSSLVESKHDRRLWLSDISPNTTTAHPGSKSHQLIADVITGVWNKAFSAASHNGHLAPFPTTTMWSAADLRAMPSCRNTLSGISAYQAIKHSAAPRPRIVDGWRLFEDRPGKPGWISETSDSRMRIRLQFGKDPLLAVTFLRSYEGLGDAELLMNGHHANLKGLWEDDHERVSQSYVQWFQAGAQRSQPEFGESGLNGFGIKSYSKAELEIRSFGGKFKRLRCCHAKTRYAVR
eukprot:gnl/TRDRNA2_/TRDRNA2_29928_c0_seq1.p1 gnl/TRDRNA2_/TRDRNA2_29928_c0~~gnl/TRDRNA2_/TRDRNA2_29928_c0_seq1.p1  ORF type:complete len:498 (-),score=14.33 gnl/TRDRNA2_/TRDRNA2_29928_c0_seq1:22-1470(-)